MFDSWSKLKKKLPFRAESDTLNLYLPRHYVGSRNDPRTGQLLCHRFTQLNVLCVAVFIFQKVNIIEYKFNAIFSMNKVMALFHLCHRVKAKMRHL